MWNLIFPNKSKKPVQAKTSQRPLLQHPAGLASKQLYEGKTGAIFFVPAPACPLTHSDHKGHMLAKFTACVKHKVVVIPV